MKIEHFSALWSSLLRMVLHTDAIEEHLVKGSLKNHLFLTFL